MKTHSCRRVQGRLPETLWKLCVFIIFLHQDVLRTAVSDNNKMQHFFVFQVYKKTKSKPNIIEKISKKLQEACRQVDSKLGLTPLTYEDLQNSSVILRKNLLENPYLSTDFYLELVGKFNAQTNDADNFKNRLHSLSKLKATLQILQLVQKRFEVLSNMEEDSGISEIGSNSSSVIGRDKVLNSTRCQIKANAVLLLKCLVNVFKQGIILCV